MMSKTFILVFAICFLSSCWGMKKSVKESYLHELYIDYKHVSFQGNNSSQQIYFKIDSTNGIWYQGKLILDNRDTIALKGFEKGSHYVTLYDGGRLEIWSSGEVGQIRDSLTIEDAEGAKGIVKEKTTLYRKPRGVCR